MDPAITIDEARKCFDGDVTSKAQEIGISYTFIQWDHGRPSVLCPYATEDQMAELNDYLARFYPQLSVDA